MEFGPHQIGKLFILTGMVVALAGVLLLVLGKVGLFKLTGDFVFSGKTWKIYLPITSSIILSVILTLVLWLINHFRK